MDVCNQNEQNSYNIGNLLNLLASRAATAAQAAVMTGIAFGPATGGLIEAYASSGPD
jgi:hypothetical protein